MSVTLRSEPAAGKRSAEALGVASAGRDAVFRSVPNGIGRPAGAESGGTDAALAPGLVLKKLVKVESPETASETPGDENPLPRPELSLFFVEIISSARLGGTPVSFRK